MINTGSPQRGGKFGNKYIIIREGAASRGFNWLVYKQVQRLPRVDTLDRVESCCYV